MGRAANLSAIVNNDGAVGYPTGTGGSVTQATSKTTAVTLNKVTGQIVTNNASLAGFAVASFVLNNTTIGPNDIVKCCIFNDVNSANYDVWAGVASGSAQINLRNISAGALAETVKINFVVIKGAAA